MIRVSGSANFRTLLFLVGSLLLLAIMLLLLLYYYYHNLYYGRYKIKLKLKMYIAVCLTYPIYPRTKLTHIPLCNLMHHIHSNKLHIADVIRIHKNLLIENQFTKIKVQVQRYNIKNKMPFIHKIYNF